MHGCKYCIPLIYHWMTLGASDLKLFSIISSIVYYRMVCIQLCHFSVYGQTLTYVHWLLISSVRLESCQPLPLEGSSIPWVCSGLRCSFSINFTSEKVLEYDKSSRFIYCSQKIIHKYMYSLVHWWVRVLHSNHTVLLSVSQPASSASSVRASITRVIKTRLINDSAAAANPGCCLLVTSSAYEPYTNAKPIHVYG
jgi:hypothetical protein